MQTTNRIPDPARAKTFFENKIAFSTGPVEVERMITSGEDVVVVDVRAAEDYAKGHIPGAINVPQERWDKSEGLQKGRTNIVYCYTPTCHLAAKACVVFADLGYPVMEMDGGFEAWRENEFEIVSGTESRLSDREGAFSR
jgi:rhodanese-related sulfurtransferase